mmetsp:Transcript_10240/g.42476  ORF Transcript_10240/g.42476 Transcript_10240/m.42476 type:complete len:216 (-) Transcript_10240:2756-3403(-)
MAVSRPRSAASSDAESSRGASTMSVRAGASIARRTTDGSARCGSDNSRMRKDMPPDRPPASSSCDSRITSACARAAGLTSPSYALASHSALMLEATSSALTPQPSTLECASLPSCLQSARSAAQEIAPVVVLVHLSSFSAWSMALTTCTCVSEPPGKISPPSASIVSAVTCSSESTLCVLLLKRRSSSRKSGVSSCASPFSSTMAARAPGSARRT